MREEYWRYREYFPSVLDVQHKVTPYTEKSNFHLHSQMEIIYTISGNEIFFSEQSVFRIPAHSILLLNSMTLHYLAYFDDGEDCDRYVLYFAPEVILRFNTPEINLLDCFLRKANDGLLIRVPQQERRQVQDFFEELTQMCERRKQRPESEKFDLIDRLDLLTMSLNLGKFLSQINRFLYLSKENDDRPKTITFKEHSSLVAEICAYIDKHYTEPLSMDLITKEFSISRTQLYTIFKEVLRMSVNDYLLLVRMNKAKDLLINTDYSIEIISQMTGYGSSSSFCRTFKNRTGEGPTEYRKRQRR